MSDEVEPAAEGAGEQDPHVVDLVADELTLARSQLASGLPGLAEGTLRRRIAWLEAEGAGRGEEADAARAVLAEALWRQQRPMAARAALDRIRPGSPQRRLPMTMLVEAETLAVAGERDRATGTMERVVAAVGIDHADELRSGVPGRLAWPLPADLRPQPPTPGRPPWTVEAARAAGEGPDAVAPDDERTAAARRRLEEARVAFVAGELDRGDTELGFAVRLDPALAADGVAILEPTLGGQPSAGRLLLYGDLLRAAGRQVEAERAYDRAAEPRR
jgi:hypothetical protein